MNNEEHLDPAISRLYQATKEQPSAKIDAAILVLAREKAHSKTSKRQKMHYQRWWIPVSTAALLVMGISVTIKIMHQPESMTQIPAPNMAPLAEQSLKMDAERPQPQPLRQNSVKDEMADRPSAAAPMSTLAPAAAMMFEAEVDGISRDRQEAPKKEKKALSAKGHARSSDRVTEPEQAETSQLLKRARPDRLPQASGTMAIQSDSSRETLMGPSSAAADDSVPPERWWSTPETWLRQIDELLANGMQGEALAELGRFRLKHPDYPLPDAHQRLLAEQ